MMAAEHADVDVIALAEVLGGLVADECLRGPADAAANRVIVDAAPPSGILAAGERQGAGSQR